MATPPFDIAQTVPGDNDFVSPYPATERTFRDVVESWLLIEGNVNGRSNKRAFDFQGVAPSGVASVTTVYADDLGYLMMKRGTGNAMYLEEAPGTVKNFAGDTAPEGWLFSFGQAISRTTYARLFAAISTSYGAGDGSTTFNVPDLRGRVVAGKDDMGGTSANRLTNQTGGLNGDTLAATGGNEVHTLSQAQIPTGLFTLNDPGHNHTGPLVQLGGTPSGSNPYPYISSVNNSGNYNMINFSNTTGITLTDHAGGGAHNNVQPTIILNKIIKF